jgi:hypothetical protein
VHFEKFFIVFVPLIYGVFIFPPFPPASLCEVLTRDGIKAKSHVLIYAALTFLHLADLHLEQSAVSC